MPAGFVATAWLQKEGFNKNLEEDQPIRAEKTVVTQWNLHIQGQYNAEYCMLGSSSRGKALAILLCT